MRGIGKCKLLVCANKKRNPLNILLKKETVYTFLFYYHTKYTDDNTIATILNIILEEIYSAEKENNLLKDL